MTKTLETLEIHKTNETYQPPAWKAFTSHLLRWFHKPDLEALEVVMSAVAAHPAIEGDPCWLFVQGPSGSGKTEIIIQSLSKIPNSVVISEINRHSFLSFYQGKKEGLLVDIGKSGIFLFKDLTTLLSKREEERTEIISHLREIFDGRFVRATGLGKNDWEGKVTCIAACTPALERAWAFKRDLGERFLTVRWSRDGSRELARKAGRQRGHEATIRATTKELGIKVLGEPLHTLPHISDEMFERIGALAQLVALLRPHVEHLRGKSDVIDFATPEEPTRIHKTLSALVSAHAALWKREPGEDDFRIAKRVAIDSIPQRRLQLLQCFHNPSIDSLTSTDLSRLSKMNGSLVSYYLEELQALQVLESVTKNLDEKHFFIVPEFIELLETASLGSF